VVATTRPIPREAPVTTATRWSAMTLTSKISSSDIGLAYH
jgi:hypothetical protein